VQRVQETQRRRIISGALFRSSKSKNN
jgi:hypothetical protein